MFYKHILFAQFFFKATLLQQVSELLQNIRTELSAANEIVDELESSIRPIIRELDELRNKIKAMEHVEEIAQEVQHLKKKLAWSWVYDVDREIQEQNVKLEVLKERIPTCQTRIDKYTVSYTLTVMFSFSLVLFDLSGIILVCWSIDLLYLTPDISFTFLVSL